MSSCVVKRCPTSWRKRCPDVILHAFPRELEKIKLWLYLTGQYGADLDDMVIKVFLGKVNDSYRMCSLHFSHDSYNYDGYQRRLKRNSIPTIFNTITPSSPSTSSTIPLVPELSSSSGEQQIPSAPSADSQKSSCSGSVCTYQVQFDPKASSQPTIQQINLVPVVPQKVFLQACGISQQTNSVVSDTSPSVTTQLTETTMCKATQMHSALSGVNRQSPASRPSALAPITISSCITQSKSTVSSHDCQLEQLTPGNMQQICQATVTFLQKPSVAPNSNLPLDTKLRPEATSSSTKTVFSTLTSCPEISLAPALNPLVSTAAFDKTLNAQPINIPLTVRETKPCSITVLPVSNAPFATTPSSPIISLFQAPNPSISTSGVKSSYKNMTTPPNSIALAIVHETKPCSRTFLPVSGNMSSVTQQPTTTTILAHKSHPISVVHIPDKAPTSQTVIPDCLPPSKKRKLEPSAASSYDKILLPNSCISQPSVSTGNLYYASNNAPLGQTNCVIQKPLMVDKGVNTDFLTNRKSCCVGTYPMHRKRNAGTQTKICTKNRKIMCTLLVPNEETDESSVTTDISEDIEFNDPSSSSSSNGQHDLCEDLVTVNLNPVKVEIVSNSEVDAYVPTASDIKQEFHIKEEIVTSAVQTPFKSNSTIPDFDINTLKTEPSVKTEGEQFPISTFSQDTTHFVSQNPKIERISPTLCDSMTAIYKNPTSWETSAIQTDDELGDPNDFLFHINELSEDEDESFLVPSDAEDDLKHVFQDLDSPVENLVEEEKYIVFESCLKKLIMMIPCRSETKCMSPLTQYRKETVGSYLSVEARCSSGHTSLLWESQPRHGYEPLGNVLLSAAVLFSGSSFVKSQHMFKLLNLKSIDKTTYSRNQSMYLFPTISHHWNEEQKAVIQSVQERPLCLAGDQQLDNPGFSANYSIYSLMDVASKKICSFSIEPLTPQVTLEGLEKKGFQKAMGELQTMNADVKMVVTDRSVAVQEILTDCYPGIVHQLDLWHLFRSIGDAILVAAKHKDCEILYKWVEAIRNHLWWSLCTCCKNPDLLIKKWKSVIYHVANVHEWDGDSDCRACHHPPLPEELVNNTNWLEKGSAAHEQLKNIVENNSLLNDLKQLSFHCHSGELEIYHKTCLKYRPKSLHFFKDSMVARAQLAALDHNRNVHTVKTLVKNASSGYAFGSMTHRLEVSKGQKSWIMKALYKPTCQNFLFDIMNDVIALVKEEKHFSDPPFMKNTMQVYAR